MPRVSPEHVEARRQQILDAAQRRFAQNGFHATSMQDILEEAGLSAGGTYRYFSGKEEIIVGLATRTLGRVTAVFDEITEPDLPIPLAEALTRIIRRFQAVDAETGIGAMVVQVWGEAIRSPQLRERLIDLLTVLRRRAAALARVYQARGEIGPGDPGEIGKVLLGFMPGFILQRAIIGDVDAETYGEGMHSLFRPGRPPRDELSRDELSRDELSGDRPSDTDEPTEPEATGR